MLDIELIENTIEHLENSGTTIENCELLASLYICRENYYRRKMNVIDVVNSELEVLPSYNRYLETKEKYKQFEVVDEMLTYAMNDLCTDIVIFIANLYKNAETEAERALIVKMINENLRRAI